MSTLKMKCYSTSTCGLKQVNTALDKLRDALAKQDQWVVAGEPRALNYNGPQIEAGYRWSEIQIPVKQKM